MTSEITTPPPLNAVIKGDSLVITLPLINPPHLTKEKKSMMVASTYGAQPTSIVIDGKPVVISANCYYKAK